jgi:pimeloyl-ACP methyl ester carboxylesterase
MAGDRDLLSRLEKADAPEFIEMITHPNADDERVLRAYFGDEKFQEIQDLSLRGATRAAGPKGNVVILHGIMGSELTNHEKPNDDELIWVSIWRLLWGGFTKLGCDDAGESTRDITATGILKSYYGKQIASLSGNWNVRAFWYDWRRDIDAAASALAASINDWFGNDSPVHLVAHSMGGLVARRFISTNPARWKSMWDTAGAGKLGGRLVMLGTPNYGSFAIPLLYMGLNSLINKMAIVDVEHNRQDLLNTAKTFVGTYQMLPSLDKMPQMSDLYKPMTYGDLAPLPSRFDAATRFQKIVKDVIDPSRMIYVAGYNQSTADGIDDWNNLHSMEGYHFSMRGDGTVPHSLGLLDNVPTFFVEEEHGKLPDNSQVITAVDDILQTGSTTKLPSTIPDAVRGIESVADSANAKALVLGRRKSEEQNLEQLMGTFKVRGATRSIPDSFSREERIAVDNIMSEFVASTTAAEFARAAAAAGASVGGTGGGGSITTAARPQPAITPEAQAAEIPKITVRLVAGSIADAGESLGSVPAPLPAIDAISVGHYADVRPISAERTLGRALTKALPNASGVDVITQFSERRIIRGHLAEPFFLPDVRTGTGRLVVVAGMGQPGQFSGPELTLLVRELCWSLARLGKKHLATVLIGAGADNLDVRDAVDAWLRGIRRALAENPLSDVQRLETITFVEHDSKQLRTLRDALVPAVKAIAPNLQVSLESLSDVDISAYAEAHAKPQRVEVEPDGTATRLTVEMVEGAYRFGVMTESASAPERSVPVNASLVKQGNNALVQAIDEDDQTEYGDFMQRLLVPADLRPRLSTSAPLVITSDTTAAQIHWEMLTQPNIDTVDPASVPPEERFLGLCRGLTRQLKTAFAPVQSSTPAARGLRVLVVADPAADARLPGAIEEAKAIQKVFEDYGKAASSSKHPRVDTLKVLIGPVQASCIAVLKELMLRSYDVLHFAGHCVYEENNPAASGWIFSVKDKLILSAAELSRLDRVPQFVFSNACESGVLPDRAELRNAGLAPNFAEAFFARGVGNFVCTAWPVNDFAARSFAESLYRALLGIKGDGQPPQPMYKALQQARIAIHGTAGGVRSWGAYQHYGNPYFKLVGGFTNT